MTSKNFKSLDQRTFEQLFQSYFDYLVNFAKQYVQDQNIAEDICQSVFIKLWEKRTEINPNQSIKSYLFTSVKNRSLNYIRDHKKYRSKVLDVDLADIEYFEEEEGDLNIDELKVKLEKALASLPEKCRKVFEMSRFEGLKYREIADELDISQKTVEAHMSKAIKTLRIELKDVWSYVVVFILNNFH